MMYFNTVLHPATSPRAEGLDVAIVLPLKEVYPGAKRIADGKSVSNVSTYLSERQGIELPNLPLFARLFGGDRSEVIEGKRNLDEWVAATIGSKAIETDNHIPRRGAVQSLHRRLEHAGLKKYVTDFEAYCSPRDVARFLSLIETAVQKLNNYSRTDVHERLSGGKEHNIERIVISANGAFIPESAFAAVSRDGKTLYINENYAQMVREEAELIGVDPEAVDEDTFLHEIVMHAIRRIKGTASGEEEVERGKYEFFKGLLKGEYDAPVITVPHSERSKYQRYLDMVRVAQYRMDHIRSMYGSKLSSLFKEYVMRAIEEGADLKEALQYAEKRVKEEAKKESKKSSKESDSKKVSKAKDAKESSDNAEESEESEEGSEDDGEGSEGEGSDSDGEGEGDGE
ncbi:hypothetical protein KY361_06825 [Candidatus Woesearchaeota archaeon]|nr:hypothetical protein [Candidatus Woesearchaeota archaeon]